MCIDGHTLQASNLEIPVKLVYFFKFKMKHIRFIMIFCQKHVSEYFSSHLDDETQQMSLCI